ncbi:MAG TPA: DUF1801 domain-containing protein [Prolixibacteraceae bacterium]|nr:DUF1801 domain-containing protein [Prolixibacteraceae bacterium]
MTEIKTKQNDADVYKFIYTFADTEQKRNDSLEILEIMQNLSGCQPKMWGPSIVGFGTYHYKSERSRQEGDWFLIGFSPRKAAISLYVYSGCAGQEELLKDLGKYKMGKGCVYIKKLSDIDRETLKKIIRLNLDFLRSKYPCKNE